MALDGIASLVEGAAYVVVYWRVVLCIAVSSLLGFAAAQFVPWFSGLQAVALGFLGLIPGIAWQSAAELKFARNQEGAMPFSAAAGFGFVIGFAWGLSSSLSVASFVTGVVVLTLLEFVWLRTARAYPELLSGNSDVCVRWSALGYLAGGVLGYLAF